MKSFVHRQDWVIARAIRGLSQVTPWVAGAFLCLAGPAYLASASPIGIQGTMSNFDVFNDTGQDVYGAELDLDGLTSAEVTKTYPCHFQNLTKSDYAGGTKLVFTGYSFPPNPAYLTPAPLIFSTNGHYAVNVLGAEHFGFATPSQPTKTAFYWLKQDGTRFSNTPMTVPQMTWNFAPAVGANPAAVQMAIVPPAPPPVPQPPPHGDAVWVKVYTTELTAQADLNELISYDPDNLDPNQPSVAPQLQTEVETEWELLSDDSVDSLQPPDVVVDGNQESVVRRFEFYKYTGSYDEVHLPNFSYQGGTPLGQKPDFCGDFVMANMVAANLLQQIPEPSMAIVLVGGLAAGALIRRRRSAVYR